MKVSSLRGVVISAGVALSLCVIQSGVSIGTELIAKPLISASAYFDGDRVQKFYARLREFGRSKALAIDESENSAPGIGIQHVVVLRGRGLKVFVANKIREVQIDPNGHGGAPPPQFDPGGFDVFFYSYGQGQDASSRARALEGEFAKTVIDLGGRYRR